MTFYLHLHFFKPRLMPVVVLAGLLLTSAMATADSGWEKETVTRDGIAVYSRTAAGTTVREIRARITVSAPPDIVLEAACDPGTFKKTTDKYVESNQFFKGENPNIWFNYQLVNFPVIDKRDYCLRYKKTINPEKGIYWLDWNVSSQCAPPPKAGIVRVTLVDGRIRVTPGEDGNSSVVRYTLLADPGGNIPDWLINLANRHSLPNILREIRDASLKQNRQQSSPQQ